MTAARETAATGHRNSTHQLIVACHQPKGGHDVAPDVIRRRFASGMRNFVEIYRHRVDYWQWLDNSGSAARLIEEGSNR